MKWNDIDTSSEKIENDSFADVGNGRIKLSIGACKLIKDFNGCSYVVFKRAKQDRIYYIGLKFCQFESNSSYVLNKIKDKTYGAVIIAEDLIKTLYGQEGASESFTKHEVILNESDPRMLIVYNNYKRKYYIHDGKGLKRVRGKHIGTIIDKEWEVVSSSATNEKGKRSPTYLLKNIYNMEEINISSRALFDIEKGLTTIDNLKLSRRIGVASYLGRKRAAKKKRIKDIGRNKEII